MGNNRSTYRRRRKKLKYKNIAIVLATLLLIIVLICASCSAMSKNKDDKKPENDQTSQDQNPAPDEPDLPELPPENDTTETSYGPEDQRSYFFDYVERSTEDIGKGELILVNNKIKFTDTVNDEDLIIIHDAKNKSYWVKDRTVMVLPQTMNAINNMLADYKAATGKGNIMVMSGYRSVQYQQDLYEQELKSTGATSSSLVAMGGFSEHHTGLVIDLKLYDGSNSSTFDGTGDCEWIMKNCQNYGFVNRYPAGKEKLTFIDNEPWHFRYVGKLHATIMTEYDYCLEEYIDFLKNYTFDTGFLYKEMADGGKYLIYYVPRSSTNVTSVFIPQVPNPNNPDDKSTWDFYPYEISGNNVDGFIVTVTLKEPTPVAPTVGDDNAAQ